MDHVRQRHLRGIVPGFVELTALTSAAQGQTRGGFDGQGHLMMHGTPRFVLGVYDSGGGYSTDPAFWEDAIFCPAGPPRASRLSRAERRHDGDGSTKEF